MKLKTLLKEYISETEAQRATHFKFLPTYNDYDLPVAPDAINWTRTDENTRTINFDRRDDMQDFVNCYFELEEETGNYATISIDGTQVHISSDSQLDTRFKLKIDELVHETRGH